MTATQNASAAAELFDLAGDPRFRSLPDGAVAIEAHLRGGGDADLVVGYTNEQLAALIEWIGKSIEPAHRDRWQAFHHAVGDRAIDAGAQLGAERFQMYMRGRFEVASLEAAFRAAEVDVDPVICRNAMLLFGRDHVEMIGLEIGASMSGAIYVAVPNRGGDELDVLISSIGFLLDAQLPGTGASTQWREVSRLLLECPIDEWIYVSMPPVATPGWVKLDVGQRPLARAELVARELGVEVGVMLSTARTHGLDPVAHIGVRFTAGPPRVSVYGDLT